MIAGNHELSFDTTFLTKEESLVGSHHGMTETLISNDEDCDPEIGELKELSRGDHRNVRPGLLNRIPTLGIPLEEMKEAVELPTKSLLRNCTYLQDSEVTIAGLKIYGTPW